MKQHTLYTSFNSVIRAPIAVSEDEFWFYGTIKEIAESKKINELQYLSAQWSLLTLGWIKA